MIANTRGGMQCAEMMRHNCTEMQNAGSLPSIVVDVRDEKYLKSATQLLANAGVLEYK